MTLMLSINGPLSNRQYSTERLGSGLIRCIKRDIGLKMVHLVLRFRCTKFFDNYLKYNSSFNWN